MLDIQHHFFETGHNELNGLVWVRRRDGPQRAV